MALEHLDTTNAPHRAAQRALRGTTEEVGKMKEWAVLDYSSRLDVIGPFRTCDDAWRWIETLPAWRGALVRVMQMERPFMDRGV